MYYEKVCQQSQSTQNTCSSSVIVMICVERYIVLSFPLHAKRLLTKIHTVNIVIGTFVFIHLIFLPSIIYADVRNDECFPDVAIEKDSLLSKIMALIAMALISVLPTCLLLFFTPAMILQLHRHRTNRQRMTIGDNNGKATRHTTFMLLSAVLLYLILVSPAAIFYSIMSTSGDDRNGKSLFAYVFREFASTAAQINHTINFVSYGIISSEFRQQLFSMFIIKGKRKVQGVP